MSSAQSVSNFNVQVLYSEHHNWLKSWLYQRLGNSAEAADLTQDTFLRLLGLRSSRHFSSSDHARSYLCATAKNLCIDHWRRKEIEKAWHDTLSSYPEETAPSAERQASVLEALEEINLMLSELPAKVAKAFLLAVVCQMTDAETAIQLGVSDRMVRKYVAKAMLACLKLQASHTTRELISEPEM
ncbi:sigma-70 family RNA polymerase sigma factor [Methylophaga muralis]|uniref:Putative RNA polymerase sigma factor FecI n=1 Tax=Methylophaga muralis TaxID=291169 RepID=A0A1E3GNY5_9GAMM|nr:sigma-70 family RNA polymerase sigma factor [Methylophaga muralis]ODN65655.1 putative RNA polymerase sigma factor FecI [Methylophaga muralis]